MAKALTVVLLLAATAAFAAAHPSMGKGGIINIMGGGGNGTAEGTATKVFKGPEITVSQGASEAGGKGSSCKCKTDCQDVEKKACREVEVEKEVCKDEDETIEEVICVQRCFKADKVITIGKGRRLLTANTINTMPHMVQGIAKAAIVGGNSTDSDSGNTTATATKSTINLSIPHFGKGAAIGGSGNGSDAGASGSGDKQQQEVCRDVCKPEQKTVKKKVCKKVKNTERVDCRVISVEPVCSKSCECGFIGGHKGM